MALLFVGRKFIIKIDHLPLKHLLEHGEHSEVYPIFKRLSSFFFRKGMLKDVKNFVRECTVCQRFKTELVASPGLLQPLPIPEHVWTDLSMDFISGLPKSYSMSTILVVADRLSKNALALKQPFTTIEATNVFINTVVQVAWISKIHCVR